MCGGPWCMCCCGGADPLDQGQDRPPRQAEVKVQGDALIIETRLHGKNHIKVMPLGKIIKGTIKILAKPKKE